MKPVLVACLTLTLTLTLTPHPHSGTKKSGNLPSHDAQGRWWEMLSPTQVLTGCEPSTSSSSAMVTDQVQANKKKRKKRKSKCHGNRKLYHFKRKCRARGLTQEAIQVLIQARQERLLKGQQQQLQPDQSLCNGDHDQKQLAHQQQQQPRLDRLTQASIAQSIKSFSQLSISQRSSKQQQEMTEPISSMDDRRSDVGEINLDSYRYSKYLKMPRKLLLRSLRLQLDLRLKSEIEQNYVLRRLHLLDEQFCFSRIRQLYQSYLDWGSPKQIWPAWVMKKVPKEQQHLTGQYIREYWTFLNGKVAQCEAQLRQHIYADPFVMGMSVEVMDSLLKEFVRLHHLDLIRLTNYQVNRFRDDIQEQRWRQQLEKYSFTQEQKSSIDRLLRMRDEQLKIFERMTLFQQRILCHRLPRSFHQMAATTTITDAKVNMNVPTKTIQEEKRQRLYLELEQYEQQLLEYEHRYHKELSDLEGQLWKQHYSNARNHYDRMMLCLQNYLTHHKNRRLRTIRYRESYVRAALRKRQRQSKSMIDVYPQVIVDVGKVCLNRHQLDYLSHHGPNYIRPNQSYLYPDLQRDRLIKRQYEGMINTIVPHLVHVHHLPSSATVVQQLCEQIKTYLYRQYTSPLSYLAVHRTRQELKLVQSIRSRLKRAHQILPVTDKGGIFHIGAAHDYERKAEAYRMKTQAYLELDADPLWMVFDKVVQLLNDLRAKKQIMAHQLEKMMPKREKVALAYLYFVPKPHKEGTPLRPIVSSIRTPTSGISKFLDRAIRPLFDKHARSTTIIDGVDLIRRVQSYAHEGRLQPSTLFCTFDITDLYTMLPQEESLNVLTEFLLRHGYRKVKGIPIDAIRKLARIVIEENVFVYGEKFYRQIVGGAMGSPFTLTLANIFMWKWEQQLVQRQQTSHEIYGRYIDDIFITWNDSLESLHQMLDETNGLHPNIKLVRQIGQCLPFLDVLIENQNGLLFTSVYHKTAAEPYLVPFSSDHPRHIFQNIVETELLRALRYSSTWSTFNHERRSIQLMLLYNGYPPRYIDAQMKHFFWKYLHLSSARLLFVIEDENEYQAIRSLLLAQPTSVEQQVLSRIASINDPPKTAAKGQSKWDRCLIVHYTHEQLLACFKRDLHRLWNAQFAETPIKDTRLIVGNRINRNTKSELIHYRPSPCKHS